MAKSDSLEDGILVEWTVSSQGYTESASATFLTKGADRIRVTELLPKGRTAERDEAIVRMLAEGMPKEGGQELTKPRWYDK